MSVFENERFVKKAEELFDVLMENSKLDVPMVGSPIGPTPHPKWIVEQVVQMKRALKQLSHQNAILASALRTRLDFEDMDEEQEDALVDRIVGDIEVKIQALRNARKEAEENKPTIILPQGGRMPQAGGNGHGKG